MSLSVAWLVQFGTTLAGPGWVRLSGSLKGDDFDGPVNLYIVSVR